MDKLVKLLH